MGISAAWHLLILNLFATPRTRIQTLFQDIWACVDSHTQRTALWSRHERSGSWFERQHVAVRHQRHSRRNGSVIGGERYADAVLFLVAGDGRERRPTRGSLLATCESLSRGLMEPSLLTLLSVLSLRGLRSLALNDIILTLRVDEGDGQIFVDSSAPVRKWSAKYFSCALEVSPQLWTSYYRIRQADATKTPPPTMYARAFAVAERESYQLSAMLPTNVASPFAFQCDAPWMLDIDRQGLLNDPERGREWNANIWHQLPALFAQYCRWLCRGKMLQASTLLCLTTLDRAAFEALLATHCDVGTFRAELYRVLADVEILPCWSENGPSWTSFQRNNNEALLEMGRESIEWMDAVPRSHLLLPATRANAVFTSASVDLLLWLGYVRKGTVSAEQWLAALAPNEHDEERALCWSALIANAPGSCAKTLPLLPLNSVSVKWQLVGEPFLLPGDDAFNSFLSPALPSLANWASVDAMRKRSWRVGELSLRRLKDGSLERFVGRVESGDCASCCSRNVERRYETFVGSFSKSYAGSVSAASGSRSPW
jgi:hypothetical protein